MKLQIKVNDDGIIEDVKFKTYGCGLATISSSLLTEWVRGQSLNEVEKIKNSDIDQKNLSFTTCKNSLFSLDRNDNQDSTILITKVNKGVNG